MTDDTLPPLVSVCIPTYNRADRLARAISAIQVSTYSNLEIIISDNASPDHTEETCRALAAADSRISYHRHPVNLGPTHNFNFAKSMATGEYFLWHGDDDFIDPGYIERCVRRLEEDGELALVAGVSAYDLGGGRVRYGNTIQLLDSRPLMRVLCYIWQVLDNSIFCGVYRRQSVIGLSIPNVLAGDWVWMASVAWRGKAEVLPDFYVHRDHGDTTSSSLSRICRVLGLSPMQAWLPWFFTAKNLCNLVILTKPEGSRLSERMARLLIAVVAFSKFPIQKCRRGVLKFLRLIRVEEVI